MFITKIFIFFLVLDIVFFFDEGFDVIIEINLLEMDGGWCFL